jgi:hypothetical protein
MSLNGTQTNIYPNSLDGLQTNNVDSLYINGQIFDPNNLVPYTNSIKDLEMGSNNIKTSHAPTEDDDVVNLLTLQNAVAYIDGINVANFVKYTGSNQNVDLGSNNLTVGNTGQVSFSNIIKTQLNNILSGYNPASVTVGNNFGTITNTSGVYQSTSTAVFASLVLGTLTSGNKYSVSLSLKSVDVNNYTNLYFYGSTTPNMTGSTGSMLAFTIPPNTTGFTVFTNTITFPVGSTYLLLVYYSQKPSGIDTLYWNAYSVAGMGSVVQNLIAPNNPLDATNKNYVDTQDNAVANFASATYVGYTNSFKDVDLTLVGNNSLKGYNLTATNKVIAPTAQFTAITSATPSLALGVDASGNLNTFAVPTATNILPLNNTFTGINTFNNNLTTGDGYNNNFGDAVYTGVNAITTGTPTTTGITAIAPVPLPTISFSAPTYTCTPSGTSLVASFWCTGTFTQNVRYFFTFTNATTTVYSATAQLTVCQANTANTAYIAISTAYNLPSTSTAKFSGYFTPNTNASYTGQVFFILSNVKFVPFTWTAFSYGIGALTVQGNETIIGNVGIGLTNPAYPLDVSGVIRSSSDIKAGGSLIVGSGGTYTPGCIFSNSDWGIIMRALTASPPISKMLFTDASDTHLFGVDTNNRLYVGTKLSTAGTTRNSGIARLTINSNYNDENSGFAINASDTGSATDDYTLKIFPYVVASGIVGYKFKTLNASISYTPISFYKNMVGINTDQPNYNFDVNGTARVYNGNFRVYNGDDSMCYYGNNATWGALLVVGSGTNKVNYQQAQVITTNGNLHIDAGYGNAIYYGYYANSYGSTASNPHYFYGGDYNFQGMPQNYNDYSHVVVLAGDQLRRSQCMMRQIYREESIAWGGGVNMTYAFYKYNAKCPVKISGKYSMYSTYIGLQYVNIRIYSRLSGAYFYYTFRTYQNITYAQTTYPFEIILTEGDLGAFSTDWFDIYIYNAGGVSTDGNNQLHVCVQVMPVGSF